MNQRRRRLVRLIALAVGLAMIVHLDWHAGRPGNMRWSLDWDLHWLLGLPVGAGTAWLVAQATSGWRALRDLAVVAVAGLFLGQIIEPAMEVYLLGATWEGVSSAVRWGIFAEFVAAWGVGAGTIAALSIYRTPRRSVTG